jgi:hypothetical protein
VVAIPDFLPPPNSTWSSAIDRFDGGTLNRFVKLSADLTPATLETVRSERFSRLYRAAQGRPFPLSAVSLYYTRHGPQSVHDLQKDLHSDTFHPSIKLWYFTADVPRRRGPSNTSRGAI